MTVLSFLLFLALCVSYSEAAHNVTINATDTSLHFTSGWNVSQNSAGQQFLFIDELGTVLMASLPNATSHVFFIGLKRSGGSAYGFCLDCNAQTNVGSIVIVDGHDPTLSNDTIAKLDVIFSSSLDPSHNHILAMFNLPDIRFDNLSQVTFNSLIVTIEDGENEGPSSKVVFPNYSASSTITGVPSTLSQVSATWSGLQTSEASTSFTSVSGTEKERTWSPATSSSTSSRISYTLSKPLSSSSQYVPPLSSSSPPVAAMSSTTSAEPSGSSGNDNANITPLSVNKSLIVVIVTLSSVAVLSLVLGLFLFFRQRGRQTRRRLSEPLSFTDRRITSGPPELPMMESLDNIGPLAAAGREPPPRRNVTSYANAVVGQWPGASNRQMASSTLPSSQDMWTTRLAGNQIYRV
ncbi:uncharacterized protein EV420DRAFT_1637507 [Desarmillaria tabescens]|uniref:Mid2 domain-containing protein n=1 Tax=Armillaria tabescens TaxID=1929756 RepID=A0AA39NGS8_ARMTA|nr:uncharacterized protein EV420DRAFT_1637507 [Desarmillaria tabescens]KAK0465367.1 hypothetical protein EV420DRAFT_1637507 [Desarmillaria tabescens]